jgi:uncharacterized CHY-type Zn-finger protein
MLIHGHLVKGINVDSETRCHHYHSEIDRIAIKFYCCNTYYLASLVTKNPDVLATGLAKRSLSSKAVLCGSCGTELTIYEYLSCEASCPSCKRAFNPGCNLHKHLYFEA